MDVLIEPNLAVDVTLDGGWHLPAIVASVTEDHVDLRLDSETMEPATMPGDLRFCRATMAWSTRMGTASRDGMLVAGPEGLLRLHTIGAEQSLQRRSHVRVPADLVAAIIGEDHRVVTRTLDISVGGMLLSPVTSISHAQPVKFAISLGDVTVTGVGEVVRSSEEGAPAVRFSGLHDIAEREIAAFVEKRRRELAYPPAA
jgi:hypothetical protein